MNVPILPFGGPTPLVADVYYMLLFESSSAGSVRFSHVTCHSSIIRGWSFPLLQLQVVRYNESKWSGTNGRTSFVGKKEKHVLKTKKAGDAV